MRRKCWYDCSLLENTSFENAEWLPPCALWNDSFTWPLGSASFATNLPPWHSCNRTFGRLWICERCPITVRDFFYRGITTTAVKDFTGLLRLFRSGDHSTTSKQNLTLQSDDTDSCSDLQIISSREEIAFAPPELATHYICWWIYITNRVFAPFRQVIF